MENSNILAFFASRNHPLKRCAKRRSPTVDHMFALPGYVYLNAVSGIGKTRVTFLFQLTTTFVYLGYLYGLSYCSHADLALYLTAESLFVMMLGAQSLIYLKKKQY